MKRSFPAPSTGPSEWDRYDTRHTVFQPSQMAPDALEAGYWRAYQDFYRWSAIWQGASTKNSIQSQARHFAYAAGWKKFEPLWDLLIRAKRVTQALPILETILGGLGRNKFSFLDDSEVVSTEIQPAIRG